MRLFDYRTDHVFFRPWGRSSTATFTMPRSGLHKWALEESQPLINANVKTHHASFAFTCVRNPYTRILSSFFDKICGIQRNGKRYRGNLVPLLIQKYGIEVGDPESGFRVRPDQELPAVSALCPRHHPLAPSDGPRHSLERDERAHVSTFIVNGGRITTRSSGPKPSMTACRRFWMPYRDAEVSVKLKRHSAVQRK